MKISKAIVCTVVIAIIVISAFSATAQARISLLENGRLYVYGSSTVYPISEAAKPGFEQHVRTLSTPFTSTTVLLNDLGSGYGFNALTGNGMPISTDIAASSKPGTDSGLFGPNFNNSPVGDPQEFLIGYDSIAIIVPDTNTWLSKATSRQVADLFRSVSNSGTGASSAPMYATWGEWANVYGVTLPVGVANQPIERIGREISSGTFDAFNTFFLKPNGYEMSFQATGTFAGKTTSGSGASQAESNWLPANYQGLTTNADVEMALQNGLHPYAIGFIGLGFVQSDLVTHPHHIIPLSLVNPQGVAVVPSVANVKDERYVNDQNTPIIRGLWYFMDSIPSATNPEAVKSLWISYVRAHPEFLSQNGYITTNLIDFAGTPSGNTGSTGTKSIPDGKVNFTDLLYFTSGWAAYAGPNRVLNPYLDLNADGKIDFRDLLLFTSNWAASQ